MAMNQILTYPIPKATLPTAVSSSSKKFARLSTSGSVLVSGLKLLQTSYDASHPRLKIIN